MTSSNVLFCPQPKDIQFKVKKVESIYVWNAGIEER